MAKKKKNIRRKPITWRDKTLREMDKTEITSAIKRLKEGWKAELPPTLLCSFTGLSKEDLEEIKRKNPKMAELEKSYDGYLKAVSRVNVARDIYEAQDVKTSQWLLEHTDDDFKPAAKLDVKAQQVVVPIEDKEQEIRRMFENYFNESTESTVREADGDEAVADGSNPKPLQKDEHTEGGTTTACEDWLHENISVLR